MMATAIKDFREQKEQIKEQNLSTIQKLQAQFQGYVDQEPTTLLENLPVDDAGLGASGVEDEDLNPSAIQLLNFPGHVTARKGSVRDTR